MQTSFRLIGCSTITAKACNYNIRNKMAVGFRLVKDIYGKQFTCQIVNIKLNNSSF